MKFDIKKITKRAFLIYTAINVFTYLFAHVAYLFANDAIGELFEYVSYYLSKSVEFLAPPIIATVALFVLINGGKGALIKFSLAVASARIFYSLPYYYIIFIYNYAYDSFESIALSLVASAAVILLTFLGTLISLFVYSIVLKRYCEKNGVEKKDFIPLLLSISTPSDFLSPTNVPILTFAITRFIFSLLRELIDTVTFFIEYRSDYLPKEIITILANFVLLFLLLIISYVIATSIRNAIVRKAKEDDDSEVEKTV